MKLGRHSYIGECQYLFNPDVNIGNFCSIASQVVFFGSCEHPSVMNKNAVANFPFWDLGWGEYTKTGTRGPIEIGSDVWIGERVIILDGVHIGNGAIIGAGCVVGGNVPDYAVMVGNPAEVKRMRFAWDIVDKLKRIAWWTWTDEAIKKSLPDMECMEKFVEKYGVEV